MSYNSNETIEDLFLPMSTLTHISSDLNISVGQLLEKEFHREYKVTDMIKWLYKNYELQFINQAFKYLEITENTQVYLRWLYGDNLEHLIELLIKNSDIDGLIDTIFKEECIYNTVEGYIYIQH